MKAMSKELRQALNYEFVSRQVELVIDDPSTVVKHGFKGCFEYTDYELAELLRDEMQGAIENEPSIEGLVLIQKLNEYLKEYESAKQIDSLLDRSKL